MRKLGLVLVLVALVVSIPAMADAGDKIIRFGAVYSSPTGSYSEIFEDELYFEEITFEPDAAFGPYVGFEFMFTDLFGIDATVLLTDHDIDACIFEMFDGEVTFDEQMRLGSISSMPLLISGHFHVFQNSAIDLYLGPTIGYNFYGDLEFVSEFEEDDIAVKNDFLYGIVFGLDKGFGSGSWFFHSAIRYLATDAEADDINEAGEAIGFDPWMVHVGVGKRW